MTATTFIARTETGRIVNRSSSTRTYAFAVIVSDETTAGAWGWSGDRVNAEKMAQQARKAYASTSAVVRIVDVERIQKTEKAFAAGNAELAWHTVDCGGTVTRYGRSKQELLVG